MNLKLQVRVVKKYLQKYPNETLSESIEYWDDSRLQSRRADQFSEEQLNYLEELCSKAGDKRTVTKIQTYRNIKADPEGRKVGRLEDLAQALKLYLSKAENHWLFLDHNGVLLPYYIGDIEYEPYNERTESPAYTRLELYAIKRGHNTHANEIWHADDLRAGKTVSQLLNDCDLYLPTPESMAAYRASMERYEKLQPLIGEQFVGTGDGEVISDSWRDRGDTSLVKDGIPSKLVLDDTSDEGHSFGDGDGLMADKFWQSDLLEDEEKEFGKIALPKHPYLKLFNLESHSFIICHVDQLEEYRWNPGLGEKLILPEDHKDIVTVLMDTAQQQIDDIIAGKTGGTIVICTGPPGTGKTLTAEVTSEVIKRPLYTVQCSQLGTDEENIEKELKSVLSRASRWKALLLIDEADVYVRERGEDIQQNAIVGVFLRLLEYYRGVLFLTSNLATVIDDAIMSRATAHLKYRIPDKNDLRQIWNVLCTQFGVTVLPTAECVETFPGISGRDVKNLLKLGIRYAAAKKIKLTVDVLKKLAVHKDITAERF